MTVENGYRTFRHQFYGAEVSWVGGSEVFGPRINDPGHVAGRHAPRGRLLR